jgi:hypothetical protein
VKTKQVGGRPTEDAEMRRFAAAATEESNARAALG